MFWLCMAECCLSATDMIMEHGYVISMADDLVGYFDVLIWFVKCFVFFLYYCGTLNIAFATSLLYVKFIWSVRLLYQKQ